jgi:hypothetical protein
MEVTKDDLSCGETMRFHNTDTPVQDKLDERHAYKHQTLLAGRNYITTSSLTRQLSVHHLLTYIDFKQSSLRPHKIAT